MSIRLDMAKEKGGGMFNVVEFANIDGCQFLSEDTSINFVYLYKKMMLDSSQLIKCPLPNGYKFNFESMRMDPNRFPYLPDTKFLIRTELKVGKDLVTIRVNGKIHDLKKRKRKL